MHSVGVIIYTLPLPAIERLHEKEILHRDISLHNILISDEEGKKKEGRGLLIDFDHAISLLQDSNLAFQQGIVGVPFVWSVFVDLTIKILFPQGTRPFMANDVLSGGIMRRYDHDLESLFYVMFYLFCTSAGPNGLRQENVNISGTSLQRLFGSDKWDSQTFALRRERILYDFKLFESELMQHISTYFNIPVVRKCVNELCDLLFRATNEVLERAIRAAFNRGDLEKEHVVCYTPRDKRDPADFFGIFKSILQKAYDGLPHETGVPSRDDRPTAVQEQPSHDIDQGDNAATAEKGNPTNEGPGNSGVTVTTTSDPRKRKNSPDDNGFEASLAKRPRLEESSGEVGHNLVWSGGRMGVGSVDPKTPIEDHPKATSLGTATIRDQRDTTMSHRYLTRLQAKLRATKPEVRSKDKQGSSVTQRRMRHRRKAN